MMNLFGTGSGVNAYLDRVRAYPMLSAEEERALARRWRDHGETAALERLAGSHLRLVVKMARKYMGYGFDLDELVAEGNLGLMQAIVRFEPERGFRLATYATWWIQAAINEHVLRSWSLVRMGTTAAQKRLFFRLRALKARLNALDEGDLAPETVAAIARTLGVAEAEVTEMNRRLGRDASLATPIGDDTGTAWVDQLADERPSQESAVAEAEEHHRRRALMEAAMTGLTERERHILRERRLRDDPPTLEALSHRYNVSRERIRQIEERAFQKVRDAVLNAAGEPVAAAA